MKKNRINAFTLVEMLIVIVIIGILIAALMPRMQAAQGRARDVSRKTALSQIQSAIVVRQGDNGKWPGQDGSGADGMDVSSLETELTAAGMNGVPKDPLNSKVTGLGEGTGSEGAYRYIITKRNGTDNGGFVLMAKTEVEGGSNWLYCSTADEFTDTNTGNKAFKITKNTDLAKLTFCETFVNSGTECTRSGSVCTYGDSSMLRYIVTY